MITVRNIETREEVKVSSLRVVNGKIATYYDFAEPSQKWLAKFPFCLKTEETIIDEKHHGVACRVFLLAEGYELTKAKSHSPKHAAQPAPAVADVPAEEPATPEAEEIIEEPAAPLTLPEYLTEYGEKKATEQIISEYALEFHVMKKSAIKKELSEKFGADLMPLLFAAIKKEAGDAPQPAPAPAAEMPSMDAAAAAFAALTPLFSGVEKNVTASVMKQLEPLTSKVEAICARAPQTVVHEIRTPSGTYKAESGEVFHKNFDDVCSRTARGSWTYLYGPTGSGKNVMCEQIAKALNLPFHYQAHTLDRFELTGFIDAQGCYQPTEFYKAYTEGGLFMLDELDASDENALVTLNSAANGYFAFPHGTMKAHPDFRCIAAGNTCGRGGSADYTGRHTIDVSSLGRFAPRFHDYSDEIDRAAANNNEELVEFVHALRRAKNIIGHVQIIASPRQIKEIVKDEAQGLNLTQTLTDLFVTYLTRDELNILKETLKADTALEGNKYMKAFSKAKAVEY